MKKIKLLSTKSYSLFIFLIYVFSCWLFIFSLNSCKSKSKNSQTEQLPSQIVTNFTLFESASGQRLYRLFATKAYVYEEGNNSEAQKIVVNQPHILFYDEDGSVYSTLDAKKGVVYTQSSDLVAQDIVVVQTSDGTILQTDSLVWNNRERIITTDAWVKIENRQGVIEGRGLISDAALKRIEIKSSVTGKSTYEF
ncbi:MAG: LPS export ABC transporter periplasmic protein LptC [candidate division WOR-3 bacterium]